MTTPIFVVLRRTMRIATFEARKFREENRDKINKLDMSCPISFEMNDGRIYLFMSEKEFYFWSKGRRDYQIIDSNTAL